MQLTRRVAACLVAAVAVAAIGIWVVSRGRAQRHPRLPSDPPTTGTVEQAGGRADPFPRGSDVGVGVGSEEYLSGGELLILQRFARGLSPMSPLRKVQRDRMRGESIEQMIANVGDLWSMQGEGLGGISVKLDSPDFLVPSLASNLRVISLIQAGRSHPDKVAKLVAADVGKRAETWRATVAAYEEKSQRAGPLGIVGAHDGAAAGPPEACRYVQDNYAVPAGLFILANVESREGLDALARYGAARVEPNTSAPAPINRRAWALMDKSMALLAAAVLLERFPDPSYDQARDQLRKMLGDRPAYVTARIKAPGAVMGTGDPMEQIARLGTSSEPTMEVFVPDPGVAADLDTFQGELAFDWLFILIGAGGKRLPPPSP